MTEKNQTANPIAWVEIPVTDMARAKTFYGHVFGFEFEMNELGDLKMAFLPTAPQSWGCGGALMLNENYIPSHEGPQIYFSTADIEGTLKKVETAGGIIFQHKKSIGPYGFIAFFEDSEGNRIGLHSMK